MIIPIDDAGRLHAGALAWEVHEGEEAKRDTASFIASLTAEKGFAPKCRRVMRFRCMYVGMYVSVFVCVYV